MKILLKALYLGAAFTSLIACNTTESHNTVTKDDGHHHDPASVHGMLLFGTEEIYLSHLPMFHSPHDYQVLLKTRLVKSGSDPKDIYVRDRNRTGTPIYTIVPEPFVLPELFPADPNTPARTSFRATLYRGHFERGGSPIVSNLTVEVETVILARKLTDEIDNETLSYLIFGNESELFAAHWIQAKPDFDHIASVRIMEGVLTEEQATQARMGSRLSFNVTNTNDNHLQIGEQQEGMLALPTEATTVGFDVLESIYLEINELSF